MANNGLNGQPEIGDIKDAWELGYKGSTKRIWHACEICGKPRWVQLIKGEPERKRCFPCSVKTGEGSNHWKGGRTQTGQGYIQIRVQLGDFFFPMAIRKNRTGGYVFEHRLVMAKHLKRCLWAWEVVHHRNGIKDDNRLENLVLLSGQHGHVVGSIVKSALKRLEVKVDKQNTLLEELHQEIRLLRWENKQLKEGISNESNV